MKYPNNNNNNNANRERKNGVQKRAANNTRRQNNNRQDNVDDLLKMCLEKIYELQEEISKEEVDEEEADPEVAGYVACALETLTFLSNQGLSADHPIMKNLKEKLLEKS